MRNRGLGVLWIPASRPALPLAPDVIAWPFLAHNHTPENFPVEAALSISAFHAATAAPWVTRSGTGAPAGGGIPARLMFVIPSASPSLTGTDIRLYLPLSSPSCNPRSMLSPCDDVIE